MAVDTATTARGKLMLSPRLRLSPATAMVAMAGAMAATGVDTTARGLLMLSLRPMLLLRLAMAMVAMVATVVVMEAMARGLLMLSLRLMLLPRLATATAGATARGRLRLSPAMATVMAVDTAMVATVVVMEATDTARGLLSPAMATGATAMVVTVVV